MTSLSTPHLLKDEIPIGPRIVDKVLHFSFDSGRTKLIIQQNLYDASSQNGQQVKLLQRRR
jgi:hypothetical protein